MRAEELRKSILQQAIQGKLVKQNPADEPASVLLERIRAEKDRLVAEGKLKKDKNPSHIFQGDDGRYYEKIGKATPVDITDDLPFEIPENWTWVRIKTIANLYTGNSISDIDKKKKYAIKVGYNFVATKDVGFDYVIRYDESIHIPFDTDFRIAPANKTLLCIEGGSAGRKMAMTKDAVCFGNKLACFDAYCDVDKFLYYYIQSPELQKIFKDSISGMIGGVSINKLKEFYLPLPPLAEQERIVQVMQLVDEYVRLATRDKELDDKIKTFIKQFTLQQAIQGNLVEQDENDEPASLLLERIRTEKKVQLGKKYVESYIYKDGDCYYEKVGSTVKNISDEIPFDIPDSWSWARLGYIVDFSKSTTVSSSEIDGGDWILDLEDIEKETGRLLSKKRMSDVKSKSDKHKFYAGNVLYSKLRPYLNKVIIADENGYCTTEILAFDFGSHIYNRFAQICLMSNYFVDYAMAGAYGIKMPRIGSERGNRALIPIPPLAEQKRIVEKLNEILPKL